MRRLLLLTLEFVAITVPLTWMWLNGGREAYHRFFIDVAHPMLVWFGAPNSRLAIVPHRFISYVPFIALMIVTPGLSFERRVFGMLGGAVVLFLSHVGFVLASIAAYDAYGETPRAISEVFPVMMLLDSLPFVLWFVIANRVIRESAAPVLKKIFPPQAPREP